MRKLAILGFIALAAAWSTSRAIVGCLTAATDLVERAELVVLARIDSIEKVKFEECSAEPMEGGKFYPVQYNKCGGVFRLTVFTLEHLKGPDTAPRHVYVASESPLSLTCDDRPPVGAMAGLTVLLFLETDGGRLWSLDGPNSLYSWSKKPASDDSMLEQIRSLCGRTSTTGTAG